MIGTYIFVTFVGIFHDQHHRYKISGYNTCTGTRLEEDMVKNTLLFLIFS